MFTDVFTECASKQDTATQDLHFFLKIKTRPWFPTSNHLPSFDGLAHGLLGNLNHLHEFAFVEGGTESRPPFAPFPIGVCEQD
jgi:hypothetical protein